MKFLRFLLLLFVSSSWASAQQNAVVSQKHIGNWACGPCSVYNSLNLGAKASILTKIPGNSPEDKVRYLIKTYGNRPSLYSPARKFRFSRTEGITNEDLVLFYNDFLSANQLAPVQGKYLDLQDGESSSEHLHRVYSLLKHSLSLKFSPIIEIQSFAAQQDRKVFKWNALYSHFVSVVQVPDSLSPSAPGFAMKIADSISGRVLDTYVYAEQNRSFTATKKMTVNAKGKIEWEWISGYPYLMIIAPKLPEGINKMDWNIRTTELVKYIIYPSRTGKVWK